MVRLPETQGIIKGQNIKKMKKNILLVTILALVAFSAYYFLFSNKEEILEDNFSETGNIAINNPGLKPGTFYLVYEEPGSPGLSVELSFADKSSCFSNGEETDCSGMEFDAGDRVEVKGFREEGIVRVSSIDFLSNEEEMRQVFLYYYNPDSDKDQEGNILCSRQGVMPLQREIPVTITPIQDTIKLLLEGNLTQEERNWGFDTEFPLDGFSLESVSLADGILTLEFNDSENKTVGGSCRVGVLWFQIELTAKQFPEVEEVRFLPEELFQP